MLRRTMALGLALALALTAGSAAAQQQCNMGVYANADGTGNSVTPSFGVPFTFYVVAFTEDIISGASFSLSNPDPANLLIINRTYGPNGLGINIPTPGGENVGLGECAAGFGGLPILVMSVTAIVTGPFLGGEFCLGPNADQDPSTDPSKPQINSCVGNTLLECDATSCLRVNPPCMMGVYADAGGTQSAITVTTDILFDLYVVVYSEAVLSGAAFDIIAPSAVTLLPFGATYGPSGNGVNVPTPGGNNVGFGECAPGFGGLPMLVMCLQAIVTTPDAQANNPEGGSICVGPNTDQDPSTDPSKPQVNSCDNQLRACDAGPCLLLETVVSTDSKSFGAVKSLYHN